MAVKKLYSDDKQQNLALEYEDVSLRNRLINGDITFPDSAIYATFDPEPNNLSILGSKISRIEAQYQSQSDFQLLGVNCEDYRKSKVNLYYYIQARGNASSGSIVKVDEQLQNIAKNNSVENINYGYTKQFSKQINNDEPVFARYLSSELYPSYLVTNINRNNLLLNIYVYLLDSDGKSVDISYVQPGSDNFNVDLFNNGYADINGKTVFVYEIDFELLAKNDDIEEVISRLYDESGNIFNYRIGSSRYRNISINSLSQLYINSQYYYYGEPADIQAYKQQNFLFYNYFFGYIGNNKVLDFPFCGNNQYIFNGSIMDEELRYAYIPGDINQFSHDRDFFNNITEQFYTLDNYYIKYEDSVSYVRYDTFPGEPNSHNLYIISPIIKPKNIIGMAASTLIPFVISNLSGGYSGNPTWGAEYAFIGIREENGTVAGNYIPYEWGKTKVEEEFRPENFEPYDPSADVPPEPVTPDDDGDISIGNVPVGITNAFTNCYIMNTGAVDYAGKLLWSGLGSQQAESGLTFGGMVKNFFGLFTDIKSETTDSTYRELALNTILDYFVSLRYYPIQNLFSYTQATVTDHLSVGTGQEPIVMAATGGFGVPQRRIVQMSGGQLTRAELNASGKVYNSFLDYQPNTTATLYIPYCGTVELTPSQLLDCDTIDIVYALDIMTGALSAIAMKNGTASYPLAMLQGTCGFETLVSGSNKGVVELATSISNMKFGMNTASGVIQSGLGALSSITGSNFANKNRKHPKGFDGASFVIDAISDSVGLVNDIANYLVGLPTMTAVSPISAGSMSSLASTIMPQTAYIQLTKHSADIPTNFENTYGRTTNVYGSIGNYQGYLICGNPRLEGIPCTEHERDEIFSLLTTGVYVE